MSVRFLLATLVALAIPALAAAQPVADKPQITLDPTRAYVLYSGTKSGQALELFREPNADDVSTYKAARDKALAKAKRKYASKLKDWLSATDPRSGVSASAVGPRPIEPTEQNFTFHPIELDTTVAIGPMYRFSKGDRSIYLQEVIPGTYTVYGPVFAVPNGAAVGTCLCMGTVKFKAEAGVVTDMGYMAGTFLEAYKKAKASGGEVPKGPLDLPEGMTSFAIDTSTVGTSVDPRIGAFPVKAAAYLPAGKHSNWHGVAIDRLTALPGVFRYDRDKMIDLTGGAK